MSGTDRVIVGRELPQIAAVRPVGRTRVRVTWSGGAEQEIDLATTIAAYKVFAPLREDVDLFGTVRVGEAGGSIAWGEGDSIDVSAVTLEKLAEVSGSRRERVQVGKRRSRGG